MKQETLEEAAEKYENKDQHQRSKLDFVEGAKWQQERMYSEEEVKELLTQRCLHFSTTRKPFQDLLLKQDLDWFEQFKNK